MTEPSIPAELPPGTPAGSPPADPAWSRPSTEAGSPPEGPAGGVPGEPAGSLPESPGESLPGDPAGDSPAKPRRTALVAGLAAIVVVVVALTVAIIFVGGGRKVRYEIESVDGNAQIISWATDNGGVSRIPRTQGQKVETPWSATVTFQAADQVAAVATDGATGKVSCRIFLNGRQVAESTGRQGVLCQALVP